MIKGLGLNRLLTSQEQLQVAEAIRQLEQKTDAEVVTVLCRQADDYRFISVLWAAILSLLLGGVSLLEPDTGSWVSGVDNLFILQWVAFIVLSLLFRIPAVLRRIVPRELQHRRAYQLARQQFLEQRLHHTQNALGVLILVSEFEHYVEILVDSGVSAKIEDAEWQESIEHFVHKVKAGETLAGFLLIIQECGERLTARIPATRKKGDLNELPDGLIVIE